MRRCLDDVMVGAAEVWGWDVLEKVKAEMIWMEGIRSNIKILGL